MRAKSTANPGTQKSTRVTEEDRLESLPEVKAQIRRTDPNLSAQEIERRALLAVGLAKEGDQPSDAEIDEALEGRTRRTGRKVSSGVSSTRARVAPVITSSGARKTIFGVMGLSLLFGVLRDIRSGSAATTDVIPRRMIGTFIGTVLLMILAGPVPRVARGLAILVGFAVVALNQEVVGTLSSTIQQEGKTVEVDLTPGSDFDRANPEVRTTIERNR